MDGWQLASEIHSDIRITGVKRILLSPTGRSAEEAKMKLLNWFDGYLHKPIKKKLFLEEISRVLSSARSEESVGELEGEAGGPFRSVEDVVRRALRYASGG